MVTLLYPNLLKDRPITAINEAWVADITYIRITSCFVYLSALLDLFSRKAIGYAVSQSLHASLTLEALEMALFQRNPPEAASIILTKGFSMPLENMSKG
jgi:transposase InsO family protein